MHGHKGPSQKESFNRTSSVKNTRSQNPTPTELREQKKNWHRRSLSKGAKGVWPKFKTLEKWSHFLYETDQVSINVVHHLCAAMFIDKPTPFDTACPACG